MKQKDPELEVLFEHFEKLVEKERKRKTKRERNEQSSGGEKKDRYIRHDRD